MTNAPKPSAHLTKTLFSGGNFALEPAGPFKLAFWYNLLRYRPFWLLGGLLGLLCINRVSGIRWADGSGGRG